jgi:hypothetical protein
MMDVLSSLIAWHTSSSPGGREKEKTKYEFFMNVSLGFPAIFEPTTFGLAILLCHIHPSNPY